MANLAALIALLAWIPVSALIFMCLPAARALSISYVAGWLLLPVASYELPGIPDFSKANVVFAGGLIGLLLSKNAPHLFRTFRFQWFDLTAAALCASTVATSILNGLGIWDGVAGFIHFLSMWSGPYFLGRLVFRSFDDARELAQAVFIGGLFYVPFCLFEVRMSPQLHTMLYGFAPRAGVTGMRFGGYRPSVFLESGLELGMWMTASCVAGFALWHLGRMRKIASLPVGSLLLVLLFTTVLCKSTGALVLLAAGVACSWGGKLVRSTFPLILLLTFPVVYITMRTTGLSDGRFMVELSRNINEERAGSLEFRLISEDLLIAKALQRPWFGWGGFGRSRVYDEFGNDVSVTDGRWIIIIGQLGLIGLVATYGTLLLPCFAAVVRVGKPLLTSSDAAAVTALTAVAALFAFDSLLNNFANPIYLLGAGAVGSFSRSGRGPRFEVPTGPTTTAPGPTMPRQSWPPPARKSPPETAD